MENIFIELEDNTALQIMQVGEKFQVVEVSGGRVRKSVGALHRTILGAIDEFRKYNLTETEICSIDDIKNSIAETNKKILEYFALHSEYLAELEKNRGI